MRFKAFRPAFTVGLIGLLLGIVVFAQQQDHSQQQNQAGSAVAEEHIFCPTMKAGQLCTHGTGSTLGVIDESYDKWVLIGRKYNQAVNGATLQLFKDAEGVL